MEKGEGGGVRSVCLRGGGPQPPVISISRRTGVTVQWSSSGRRSVCTHASTHTINTQIYIISIICVSVNQSSPFTSFFFLSFKKKKKNSVCFFWDICQHLFLLHEDFFSFVLWPNCCRKTWKADKNKVKMPVQCEDWARKIVKLERKCEYYYGCKGWYERRAWLGWWEGGRGVKMRTRVENITWVNTFPSSLLYFSTFFTFSSHQVL